MEITTEVNKRVVMKISELLEEEKIFSETYKYNLGILYNFYKKNTKSIKQKKTLKKIILYKKSSKNNKISLKKKKKIIN